MNERPVVILVDDNMTNLAAGRNLLKASCQVYPAPSAAKMFELLEKIRPDVILLDIEMPEMDGYQALTRLKAGAETAAIPVVFLTAHVEEGVERDALARGAAGCIRKPFDAAGLNDVIGRLRNSRNQRS
jgi:putative two-component system response regulator